MAHYAQIDESNIVTQVLVMDNDMEENEGEQACVDWLVEHVGGTWIKTSYNGNIRKQYAGIGYTYDSTNDVFIAPKPFASWTLDSSFDWQPPTPYPEESGGLAFWDEDSKSWKTD